MVIYTANYGGYDRLNPICEHKSVKYVCFTDNKDLKADGWQIEHRDVLKALHPRMRAKWFKMFGYREFSEPSIYVDSNMEIISQLFFHRIPMFSKNGISIYKHPEKRDCIYQEAEYCKDMDKYKEQPIMEQVEYYKKQGMPEHFGLWACGVIYRSRLENEYHHLFDKWWTENQMRTYQDQLSLPYLLWKYQLKIGTVELDQYAGDLFKINSHIDDTK